MRAALEARGMRQKGPTRRRREYSEFWRTLDASGIAISTPSDREISFPARREKPLARIPLTPPQHPSPRQM